MVDPLTRAVMNIIRQFGGPAYLIVTGDSVYDPATSTMVQTETQVPIKMVAQDFIQKQNGFMAHNGTLLQTGDKQFFIQSDVDNVPVPRPGIDSILFEGKKWTIKTLKDYNPSGSKSYCYECYARI